MSLYNVCWYKLSCTLLLCEINKEISEFSQKREFQPLRLGFSLLVNHQCCVSHVIHSMSIMIIDYNGLMKFYVYIFVLIALSKQ